MRRCIKIFITDVLKNMPLEKIVILCIFDERFERPWQHLKGISIKNIYVPELSYPTTKKYIYIVVHAVSLTPNARFLRSKNDHISAISKQNSKRL
jgi:hypothetical protein